MNRYALCIGNDEYEYSPPGHLKSAVSDARAVGEKLELLGFAVDIKCDLCGNEMAVAIGSLEDKLKENDAIIFYYAGHGFEVDGRNILGPIDA